MAKNKKTKEVEENLEQVENVLSRSEQFIENNQKTLSYAVLGVVAIIALYMAFQKYYKAPLEEEALAQMYVAERYFERDSFNLALNGDINYPGFLGIIDKYSSTKAANLAHYYAGISYYSLGDYDSAIEYLDDFSTSSIALSSVSKGLIGDSYVGKENYSEAVSFYLKAADSKSEKYAAHYLQKVASAYEMENNYASAIEIYEQIKKEYPKSIEAAQVDKFIARAKFKL